MRAQMQQWLLAGVVGAALAGTAHADPRGNGIGLADYRVVATHALTLSHGTVSGLEASGVAYARDRGSLFFVGDEGTGVIEISRTGQTLGSMAFDWSGTASTHHDTEGVAYLGNGVLVVGEERLLDAYRFSFVDGGTATLALSQASISYATVGNNGMEGIAVDRRDGSFVVVRQQAPQDLLAGALSFAAGSMGTSSVARLFDPAPLGLASLSDVETLSGVDALAGTPAADHLLLLSLGSRKLLEVDRGGQIRSSLDLSAILPHNAFEGVAIDERGTIYLVAEQVQDGSNLLPDPPSMLVVLTAPVPEPESWALMLAGVAVLAQQVRRRRPGAARNAAICHVAVTKAS